MKVRIIELEGTPEELAASPYLQSLAGSAVVDSNAEPWIPPADSPIAHLVGVSEGLDARGVKGRVRELVEAFLLEVSSWNDVEPPVWGPPGSTLKGGDYLRLNRATESKQGRGRPPGAFVYLFPARAAVRLRLRVEDAEGAEYAKPRGVSKNVAYQVQIPLHHEGMLKEAVSLARKAYERVAEKVAQRAARVS